MIAPDIVAAEFPHLPGQAYLNAGALSIAPRRAVEAVERMIDLVSGKAGADPGQTWSEFDRMCSEARRNAAWLLNAGEDEIALVESTTRGLSIAAEAIHLREGDRVLLCDLEYPEVAVPWVQKQKQGIAVDVVETRGGRFEIDDFAARLTPRTRVVTVSGVQWTSGFRCDLAALSHLCRERDIFLVVDAIQQLGAIPLDVKSTPADFIASGGHKWLNTPFGMGFLYVNRGTLPRLQMTTAGLLNTVPPPEGWAAYFESPKLQTVRNSAYLASARRYEIGGTTNFIGAAALAASLSLTRELGQEAIAAQIHALTDRLVAGLDRAGIRAVTNFDRAHRAGIVTLDLGSAHRNLKLAAHLQQNRVTVSVRYAAGIGGVRVSCHFYNSLADVDRLLGLVTGSPHLSSFYENRRSCP